MERPAGSGSQQGPARFYSEALRARLLSLTDDEQRQFWSTAFGIVGPEWMIILALAEAEGCCANGTTIAKA
jgi:hypothetical protein